MNERIIKIHTDGSCHTQTHVGAWAAIVIIDDEEIILKETVMDTTHNCMELLGVIKALEFIQARNMGSNRIEIFTDSQYVVKLLDRKDRLHQNNFHTKKNEPISNSVQVQTLLKKLEEVSVVFIKVAAHQKQTAIVNYNREVDKIARALVRKVVNSLA